MADDLKVGDRVRTTVHVPAGGADPDLPVGSLGSIVREPAGGAYGVLLDGDPYQLPAAFHPEELERVDG